MARPTKYTPERVEKILQAIELGATYELASSYGGVDYMTFNRWRERYSEFRDAIRAAEGKGATKWLAKIEQAASDGAWQAAAWKLERRYPHSYGRTVQNVEHTGKDGAPFTIVIEKPE